MERVVVGQGNDPDQDFLTLQGAFDDAQPGDTIHLQKIFYLDTHSLRVEKSLTIVGDVVNAVKPMFQAGGNVGQVTVGGNTQPKALPVLDVVAENGTVTIQGVDFISPRVIAIRVAKAGGVTISGCRIVGLQPLKVGTLDTATGILVGNPIPDQRATFGDLIIRDNKIDSVANSSQNTVGILFNRAGIDDNRAAQIVVEGNLVTNVTAFGIDFRELRGQATIRGNTINMGAVGVGTKDFLISGIRCLGASPSSTEASSGVYSVVDKNSITCEVETAAGIRLVSQSKNAPLQSPEVRGNVISMLMAKGTDKLNAGAEVRGNVTNAQVSDNEVSGHARAALSVVQDLPFFPSGTTLKGYRRGNFQPSIADADITLDANVSDTQVIAPEDTVDGEVLGTIKDSGSVNPQIDVHYQKV